MAVMRSRASVREATAVEFKTRRVSFTETELRDVAEASAAAAPKRARRPKEKLPVADEVDLTYVRGRTLDDAAFRDVPATAVSAATILPSPPPAVTFDGGADSGSIIPPDTMGVVNRDYAFNPLNDNVYVFDRTGTQIRQWKLDDFWKDPAIAIPMDAFDPRAVYDPIGRRFIFVSTANAERANSSLLIAVSETDDPTAHWFIGSVTVDPVEQGEVWLDFPSVGFSEDKITVQVNLYTLANNFFAGSSIYVWDKRQFYDPPHQPALQLFSMFDQGGTQVPAVTLDAGQSTQYLATRWTGDYQGTGYYKIYEIVGSVANNAAVLNDLGFIAVTGTTWAQAGTTNFAPQLGTPELIDAGDDRILSVVCRHDSLWFSHAAFLPTATPTRSAAQWLQTQIGTWSVQQLGRVDDPAADVFYAFPTLAVNQHADVLLGCAHFSATTFASGAYALRRAADPAGQMRTPFVYAPGAATYHKTSPFDPAQKNRWGDYSSTQVDPLDDLSFWTVQERASATPDVWATQWARVT